MIDAVKVIINLNRCKDGDCDHCEYKSLFYPNSFDDPKEVCEWSKLVDDARSVVRFIESMITKEG